MKRTQCKRKTPKRKKNKAIAKEQEEKKAKAKLKHALQTQKRRTERQADRRTAKTDNGKKITRRDESNLFFFLLI